MHNLKLYRDSTTVSVLQIPANTRRWPSVGVMLAGVTDGRPMLSQNLVLAGVLNILNPQVARRTNVSTVTELANVRRSPSVGSMLDQRFRRWPNIQQTQGQLEYIVQKNSLCVTFVCPQIKSYNIQVRDNNHTEKSYIHNAKMYNKSPPGS